MPATLGNRSAAGSIGQPGAWKSEVKLESVQGSTTKPDTTATSCENQRRITGSLGQLVLGKSWDRGPNAEVAGSRGAVGARGARDGAKW